MPSAMDRSVALHRRQHPATTGGNRADRSRTRPLTAEPADRSVPAMPHKVILVVCAVEPGKQGN